MVHGKDPSFSNAQVHLLQDDAHDPLLVLGCGGGDDLCEDGIDFRAFCLWVGDRIQVGVEFSNGKGTSAWTPVLDDVEDDLCVVHGLGVVEAEWSGQGFRFPALLVEVKGAYVELGHCGDLDAIRVSFTVDLAEEEADERVEAVRLGGGNLDN